MNALANFINGALRRVPPWPIYVLGPLPALWFLYLGLTGGLGVEPIRALEQELGRAGLQFLVAALAIRPLMQHAGIRLIRYRRAIALMGFYYICMHFTVWLVLDVQDWGLIWADIVKRPYITIGMAGLLFMVPLALTSNNWSVRRLGPRWRLLHRLTYAIIVLGGIHFVMVRKGWQLEPLIYLAVILALLALRGRIAPRRRATA